MISVQPSIDANKHAIFQTDVSDMVAFICMCDVLRTVENGITQPKSRQNVFAKRTILQVNE